MRLRGFEMYEVEQDSPKPHGAPKPKPLHAISTEDSIWACGILQVFSYQNPEEMLGLYGGPLIRL